MTNENLIILCISLLITFILSIIWYFIYTFYIKKEEIKANKKMKFLSYLKTPSCLKEISITCPVLMDDN